MEEADYEELMQHCGEMIDPLCGMLQKIIGRWGFPDDLPPEAIFLAAGRVMLQDPYDLMEMVTAELREILDTARSLEVIP